MTKLNKNMKDDEFLQALHQLNTTELIEAFNEINEGSYEIHDASEFIDDLSYSFDDIRYLLELQRLSSQKNLYDYDYILTGDYYSDTNSSDDIFDLVDEMFDNGWLDFKDELIEYFNSKDLN